MISYNNIIIASIIICTSSNLIIKLIHGIDNNLVQLIKHQELANMISSICYNILLSILGINILSVINMDNILILLLIIVLIRVLFDITIYQVLLLLKDKLSNNSNVEKIVNWLQNEGIINVSILSAVLLVLTILLGYVIEIVNIPNAFTILSILSIYLYTYHLSKIE
tara:strand:+ start:13432 stop:13932 length:501 start_codon:yes stop_codon:yes gene_type:complete